MLLLGEVTDVFQEIWLAMQKKTNYRRSSAEIDREEMVFTNKNSSHRRGIPALLSAELLAVNDT